MDQQENSKGNLLIPGVIGIGLLSLIAAGYFILHHESDEDVSVPSVPAPIVASTPAPSGTYKDGTYSAIGSYLSPGGDEQIGVTLTLKDGVITDASVDSKAFRPDTIRYQTLFINNFKPQVIGKNIDQVGLTRVSGSSLTSRGFNDALAQIKAQAKS